MTESNMWVEKYRPMKLSSIVNQKETIGSLKSLLKNISEMPHLMFSGSAGVGKTTTALCLAR
ncbi:MAG: replication factor C small subunit, partial [Nitrososphaerota archaeon]